MRSSKLLAVSSLLLIVVAACGGSGGTPTNGPAATTLGGGATDAPSATQAGVEPTAAGGGATTGPGVGTGDPCAALTLADLKAAFNVDYGAGVLAYGQCTFQPAKGSGITVVVNYPTGMTLATIKASFTGGVGSTVGGHDAYWDPTAGGDGIGGIWVDLGTSILSIAITPVPSDGQAIAQHLGDLAVARM